MRVWSHCRFQLKFCVHHTRSSYHLNDDLLLHPADTHVGPYLKQLVHLFSVYLYPKLIRIKHHMMFFTFVNQYLSYQS